MATDPFDVGRRYDLNSLGQQVREVIQALNLGGASRNQSRGNVPARYQFYPFRSLVCTFAQLPALSDCGVGVRAVVTDVTEEEAAEGFNGVVTIGGGTFTRPVWSNVLFWHIG